MREAFLFGGGFAKAYTGRLTARDFNSCTAEGKGMPWETESQWKMGRAA
jgi:hypothetical protein